MFFVESNFENSFGWRNDLDCKISKEFCFLFEISFAVKNRYDTILQATSLKYFLEWLKTYCQKLKISRKNAISSSMLNYQEIFISRQFFGDINVSNIQKRPLTWIYHIVHLEFSKSEWFQRNGRENIQIKLK